jgi:hypothetical protein
MIEIEGISPTAKEFKYCNLLNRLIGDIAETFHQALGNI